MEMQNKQTQNQDILKHLKSGRSITPYEALTLYGCFRLGARIYDLRAVGHDIRMTMESHKAGNGKTKRFARYWMPKGN